MLLNVNTLTVSERHYQVSFRRVCSHLVVVYTVIGQTISALVVSQSRHVKICYLCAVQLGHALSLIYFR